MRNVLLTVLVAAVVLTTTGCGSDRISDVDGGGVVLSISNFDGLPFQVSVNDAAALGAVQIDEIVIESIAKAANQATSSLQNVEMDSYEVTFTRGDIGTRVPAPLVRNVLGVVPVNGSETYSNLPILTLEQLADIPLSDLLFENGSFDEETGSQLILLNIRLRFFGRTISGENVETAPMSFSVEFIP